MRADVRTRREPIRPADSRRSAGRPLVRALASWGCAIAICAPQLARADEVDVLAVEAKCRALVCDFAVTLRHADEGWKHYADAWEVLGEDEQPIATRVLRHPHVEEQPFTRSLPRVALPSGTRFVIVRGHDKLHGYGGVRRRVEIPRDEPVAGMTGGTAGGSAAPAE